MRLLLVLLALLGAMLSGCAGIGSGPDLMTAMQAKSPADRAAERWADDAVLVDIETQELDDAARREAADEFADEREELREARDDGDISESDYDNYTELFEVYEIVIDVNDDDVGDGRASLWGFTYQSESEQDMYLVAVAHGEVVYKKSMRDLFGSEEEEFDFEDFLEDDTLGEWKVDSDDAAEAARLNEDYARICGTDNIASFMSLNQDDDGPVWSIGVSSQGDGDEDDDFAYLSVDAVNGSLIADETIVPDDFEDVEDLLFQESGSMQGDLIGSVAFTVSEAFEVVSEGHLSLAVDVEIQPALAQAIEVTITDPAGGTTQFTVVGTANPFGASEHAVLDLAAVGTYSVELTVPLSAYSQYSISWCTDGVPVAQGPFQEQACQFIEQGASGGGAASRGETLSPFARWAAAW